MCFPAVFCSQFNCFLRAVPGFQTNRQGVRPILGIIANPFFLNVHSDKIGNPVVNLEGIPGMNNHGIFITCRYNFHHPVRNVPVSRCCRHVLKYILPVGFSQSRRGDGDESSRIVRIGVKCNSQCVRMIHPLHPCLRYCDVFIDRFQLVGYGKSCILVA